MASSTMNMMSGMAMASTSTMSDMAMATGSAMDMSISNSSMMGMESMAMTFFSSSVTPLYSMAWTPTSTGQYAGTCIFLVLLSAIFRSLLAIRLNLFEFLRAIKGQRRKDAMCCYGNVDPSTIRPWRANEAVWIAFADVLLGSVGYLLMIAVMTMNVGYFLSVLGGIFLGSLIFGHFLVHSAAH